ncbi:hypothetical protein COLO4_17090 [Corchorus olitorius]|uniref:Uncharacterized protein n=1 Tax=Corchorus olitorius TaxID=93759 RepID=A0A1R3JE60_9ROSI|nr:hypothetical protein COLO4_17090 [Corchorus olitorius]
MDKFKTVRSQILSMDPLPAINRVYAMLITEEKQLSIGSSRVPIEAAAFAVKPSQKPSPKGEVLVLANRLWLARTTKSLD